MRIAPLRSVCHCHHPPIQWRGRSDKGCYLLFNGSDRQSLGWELERSIINNFNSINFNSRNFNLSLTLWLLAFPASSWVRAAGPGYNRNYPSTTITIMLSHHNIHPSIRLFAHLAIGGREQHIASVQQKDTPGVWGENWLKTFRFLNRRWHFVIPLLSQRNFIFIFLFMIFNFRILFFPLNSPFAHTQEYWNRFE